MKVPATEAPTPLATSRSPNANVRFGVARSPVLDASNDQNRLLSRGMYVRPTVLMLIVAAACYQSVAATIAAELPAASAKNTTGSSNESVNPTEPPETILSSDEMAKRVDELLAAHWKQSGIKTAQSSSDTEFLRRTYLDLTGRIPSVSEVYSFDGDSSAKRRVQLIDQLLAHRDHSTHLATVWRRFLLPDGVDLTRYGGTAGLEQWLVDRFSDNVPYNEIVRELLQAEGRVTKSGPVLFYTALKLSPEEIASQTARSFLGMRMECAQCHDHPFDERWSQEDFWGYAAFFARISRPKGKLEEVSSVMQVRDSKRGDVMLPDTEEIVPPRFPGGDLLTEQDGSNARRRELAEWLTETNNEQLARATVNRVWSQFFGRGFVEPVDDMRSDNPPVCPEVLEELTQYFVHTDFDLQNLIRTIVLTDAYQLSSSATADDPDRQRNFAQMNIKSFTAEQLYDCIAMATRLNSSTPTPNGQEGIARFGNASRTQFLEQFRAPPGQPTEYHAGIPQALTMMNGGLIHGATDISRSGLLNSMPPFFSEKQKVETLFLATLSRTPTKLEANRMSKFLASAGTKKKKRETLGNILWALLNSAEFTLNH